MFRKLGVITALCFIGITSYSYVELRKDNKNMSKKTCFFKCWELFDYGHSNLECQQLCKNTTTDSFYDHETTKCFDECWEDYGLDLDNLTCQMRCPKFGQSQLEAVERIRDINIGSSDSL